MEKVIGIAVILAILLLILIKDHICFTKDDVEEDDKIPPGYHVGDW